MGSALTEIVITGIGPVSAIGIGRADWQAGLRAGRCGIAHANVPATALPTAEVRDFNLDAILPSSKTYLDRASAFALAAGQLALADAGLLGQCARWRSGVVLGTEYGCLGTMQLFTSALQQKGARLANPLLFSHMYVNTPASLAAIEFGLGGHHGAFTGHDAGAQALDSALEALQLGRAEVILAIGVEAISEPLARALYAEGALHGEALGEGACALVLETQSSATARGIAGIPFDNIDASALPALRAQLGHTFAAEPFFRLAAAC